MSGETGGVWARMARIPWEPVLLVAALLAGVVLRLYRIDDLPPGLHYDQAHDAILGWETWIGQNRPIYFTGFTGAEPLMIYSIGVVMGLLGRSVEALKVTSALYGILTVLATYPFARDLFGGPGTWRGRWVGLFATGLMATSTWHLVNSRNGLRVITLPLFEILTLWALWLALRSGRKGLFALFGVALGLTAYTYYSSRLVPIAMFLLLALIAARAWRFFRANLGGLALGLLVAAVVVAPLAWFYYRNPEYLFVRVDQVWVFNGDLSKGDPWAALRENIPAVLAMFSLSGDKNWRFNVVPQPIFNPAMSVLALAGLVLFVWRSLTPGPSPILGEGSGDGEARSSPLLPLWERGQGGEGIPPWLPYAMTLIFLVVMLLPSFLSVEGRPNSSRSLGALPFLYFLPAVAAVDGILWLTRRRAAWNSAAVQTVAAVMVFVALVGWQGIATARGYFDEWANAAATYYYFDTQYSQMAQAALAELAAGRDVVLFSRDYKTTTIAFEAPETLESAHWVFGRDGLVVPAGDKDIAYLIAQPEYVPDSRLVGQLKTLGATFEVLEKDPAGEPSLVVARLPRDKAPAAQLTGVPSLGGEMALTGGQLPNEHSRDGKLRIGTRWAVQSPTTEARTFAVRLVDGQGLTWSQGDTIAYLSEQWRAGDVGWQWWDLRFDPAMPAGPYTVQLALTDANRKPLPVTDANGAPIGLWADVGTIQVTAENGEVKAAQPGTDFGPGLRALPANKVSMTAPPGGRFEAAAAWQRRAGTPATDATLAWVDGGGAVAAKAALPIAATYPPTEWRDGEIVRPRYALTVPASLAPGAYTLRLTAPSGESLDLGTVTVAGEAKRFEPGPIQTERAARLGTAIALLGYDVAPAQPTAGGSLDVMLHWRAVAAPDTSYARFLHLVDTAGQIRAQADSAPADGQRPTTGWVGDEVVSDRVRLSLPADLPPGRYRLVTGLYDPATLARLPAVDDGGRPLADNAVVLGEIEIGR
ncbi:MAG: glycosyltransferase family 39 protein [Anaerolineae bacterium]